MHGPALRIAELAHVAHDGKTLLLHLIALAVMVAIQRRQRFGQADEPMESVPCLSTSRTSSLGPSLSESSHTPCPIRNG